VLHLIKMWLDCPVEETDERGRKTRTTEARDHRRGIPQGSPLSRWASSPIVAVLSDDPLTVSDANFKKLKSTLTLQVGQIVYSAS
jgi:hypothetical protein